MELIDRRKLVSDFWKGVEDAIILSYEDTDDLMENAPTVEAVEVSRLGRLGKLMMPYEGCPRGKIGPTGSTEDSSDQKMQITTLDVITDVDGNRWVPVLDADLEMLKSVEVVHGRWIPVTERLPEDDLPKGSKVKQIKVLTALKSNNGVRTIRSQMRYRMTWYNSAPWAWKCSGSEITHWRPLPEPPEEG